MAETPAETNLIEKMFGRNITEIQIIDTKIVEIQIGEFFR
jgi:hypothetical protein